MKVMALKVFSDGKRNHEEGEIFDISPELFEKVNSTPNGILAKELKEERPKKAKEG